MADDLETLSQRMLAVSGAADCFEPSTFDFYDYSSARQSALSALLPIEEGLGLAPAMRIVFTGDNYCLLLDSIATLAALPQFTQAMGGSSLSRGAINPWYGSPGFDVVVSSAGAWTPVEHQPASKPIMSADWLVAWLRCFSGSAASAVVASTLLERRDPSGPGTGGGFYELLSHLGDRRSSEAHREQERGQLALHGDLAVRPILEVIRRSGTDEVVRDAAAVLERVAETEAGLAALEQYINDDDAAVRSAIAYALGSSPSEATLARRLGVLERLLTSDPSTRVRDTAISALRLVGGTSAARLLIGALEHEKIEFLREAITDAIEEIE